MATKPRTITSLSDLIREGKENGFVTQDDILALFPKPEERIPEIDQFYDQLIRAGVDV
ncbi:RNA polymerase sigma factor region1.1 domain-containing protein, partial [Candidatus Gottesmanbacteria bacterium]|nr:RNA polymerase sigma factor region1.1 domain-containing protein [Candidatus Gottesmanbacteria bacterium]